MPKNSIARWSNPGRILVATSLFDDHTLIQHAIFQARLSHAAVLVVHVISPSNLIAEAKCSALFVLPNPTAEAIRTKLDVAAAEVLKEGISCESIVVEGLPEEEIPRLVKSRLVDRVIVATRDISGVARLIDEAVAEKLVEFLDVPVCIVGQRTHTRAASVAHLGRILLATSLHSTSSMLADFASGLAEANQAHLTLLHVLGSKGMSEQQHEMARLAVRRRLAALVPNEARHRFQPLLLIREGDPASIVIENTGSLSPDLVILGAPHSSRASRPLSSSILRRVVAESRCPVITLKSTSSGLADEIHELTPTEVTSTHS